MSEQAVKDAHAKFEAAKAELDKAVADAHDEIEKTKAAIDAAVAPKALPVEAAAVVASSKGGAPAKSENAEKADAPKPAPHVLVAPAAKSSNVVARVVVAVVLAAATYLAALHFGLLK